MSSANAAIDLIQIIGAAGAALVTCVAFLFKRLSQVVKENQEKFEQITKAHSESTNQLNREIGELKGKQDGTNDLANRTLETVHQTILDAKRREGGQ